MELLCGASWWSVFVELLSEVELMSSELYHLEDWYEDLFFDRAVSAHALVFRSFTKRVPSCFALVGVHVAIRFGRS